MRTYRRLWVMPAAIVLSLGSAGFATAQEENEAPDVRLVGWWKFDDGRGGVARDSSSKGHHGQINAGQWVKGRFGTALRFDGESTYVAIPHLAEIDGSDEMTVAVWVFWEGMGRYPNILTGGAWNPGGFLMFVRDDYCSFRMGKPGKEAWELGKNWQETSAHLIRAFKLGKWYHLAATFKRPVITTYVDGKPVGSGSWNYPVGHVGDLQVGKWGLDQGQTQSHYGLIDELKIYKRALSADEAEASFEKEAARRK